MRYLFVLALSLFFSLRMDAQELRRKAWFGAQLQPIDASNYKSFGLDKAEGMLLLRVVGGSSQGLGLLPNDVLLTLNDAPIRSTQDLAGLMATLREGDALKANIIRDEKPLSLNGKCLSRPKETNEKADLLYDFADYKGGKLRVIINKPRKEGKMPAMLFIPGYTCSSLEGLPTEHPYARIINAFSDAGYVVLRIEKSGIGDSKDTPACEDCNLQDEVEGFEKGLLKLKTLPYVDTSKIYIVGHSMGGVVAPALSAKHAVKGVMVYGTTAKSWFEYQVEMNRLQGMLAKPDPMAFEQECRVQADLAYEYFIQRKSLVEMAKDPRKDSLLRASWGYDGQGKIYSRNAEYWRQIQDFPLLDNWKNTKSKVLVMFGGADFQAFSKADHEQIVYTVNHYRPGTAVLKVFPETDHNLGKVGTMQRAYDLFAEQKYNEIFESFDFEVTKSMLAFAGETQPEAAPAVKQPWRKLQTEPYPGKQDDICFVDEQHGWYVNGYGKIYRTRDAGKSWEKVHEQKGSFFRCIAFLDTLNGFVGTVGTDYFPNVTDTIPLYRTVDGGKTWTPVAYSGPYVKGLCAIDIVKEQYINHGKVDFRYHIYAVGRVGSPANMIVSHDGGKTFGSWSMNADCKMLFDIKMFDTKEGIACAASNEDIASSNALILKTKDGGKTWKKVYQSNRPFETTWKASFPSKQVGYVTIQSYNTDTLVKQQRIAKTTDGGNTWKELNLCSDVQAREFGIGFIDEKTGFVGTMNTGYQTTDGGNSWSKVDLGKACNKIRIHQTGQKTWGYAIGVGVYKLE